MKKFDKRKYEEEFINKYEAKNEYNKAKEQLIFTSNQQFNYKKVPRKRRIILISSMLLLASIIIFLSIILNLPKANNSLTYLKMEVVETNLKNNINPNILANIEGLLPEKEENELKYFAKPNSKILIAIYLNNPNNYEILPSIDKKMYINKIGRYWDNKTVEIDIVGLNEDRNIALFGECKYSKHKVGLNILFDLENKIKIVNELNKYSDKYYILFSISGFSDDLISLSKERKDSILIEVIEEYR